jgi:uncharacterized protein YbjT (DUF2867 family)
MNITVFGASGGIGGHVVAVAAQRGHHVRAVYRTAPQSPPPGHAEVLVSPDIFDPAFAAEAIRGAGLVSFGAPFLANPDLVRRYRESLPLNVPDPLHLLHPRRDRLQRLLYYRGGSGRRRIRGRRAHAGVSRSG